MRRAIVLWKESSFLADLIRGFPVGAGGTIVLQFLPVRRAFIFFCACWVVAVASLGVRAGHPQPQAPAPQSEQALVKQYCLTCHNERTKSGGLVLDTELTKIAADRERWE